MLLAVHHLISLIAYCSALYLQNVSCFLLYNKVGSSTCLANLVAQCFAVCVSVVIVVVSAILSAEPFMNSGS